MNKRVEISQRLKELRKSNKYSQQFVAENLFISQAAYSLIENSQNGIVAEHIIGLSNLYEVTTDYILKGENMLIRISATAGFIPYVQVKAHAGYIENLEGNLEEQDLDWFRIPGYESSKNHKLFEIEGESMVPTIFPRDIIICQKQNKLENILDGSLVIVVTNESVLAKRYRSSPDKELMIFENDNPDDDQVLMFNKEDIKEILMIRGKISNVLLPHKQFASQGKLQEMEESIEFLKRELYSINKKLNSLRR